jgi:hypothetical protein
MTNNMANNMINDMINNIKNHTKVLYYCLFLLSMQCVASSESLSFDFQQKKDTWKHYGSGLFQFNENIGKQKPGSMQLECSSAGDQITTYLETHHLKPGLHKVSMWLRANDIKVGPYNYSTWIFYDTGHGTVSPVKDLKGSFNWSKVTFTINVSEKTSKSTIWIRLKAQGSLWVDDISISKHEGEEIPYQFEKSEIPMEKPNPIGDGKRCENCYRWMPMTSAFCSFCGSKHQSSSQGGQESKPKVAPLRTLIDFEKQHRPSQEKYHYIRSYHSKSDLSPSAAGAFKLAAYNNLNMSDPSIKNWGGYDYLSMDIYNPLSTMESLALSIRDDKSSNYWTQLNHTSKIVPGWNHLRFHVNRFVGERGSVRVKRYLNIQNIKSCFFGVALESGRTSDLDFLVDNIRLSKAPPPPKEFAGLVKFDFVAEKFRAQPGFTAILPKHSYNKEVGFGFQNAGIWRTHDSMYADTLNRDGIFINNGRFKVDLKNGRYKVLLSVNHLGYWSEHFWNKRSVSIQGKTILNESNHNAEDFYQRHLRFADIEPRLEDNAFDLYLGRVFSPLETVVEVNNGSLDIEFKGDNSGICLNWLMISPIEKERELQTYRKQLKLILKDDYANLSKDLTPKQELKASPDKKISIHPVGSGEMAKPYDTFTETLEQIDLHGGRLEKPVQAFVIRNHTEQDKEVSIRCSALTSKNGHRISPTSDWIRRAVNQYQSHTFNHETYELSPRFLKKLEHDHCTLRKEWSQLFWLKIPIPQGTPAGGYQGELSIVGDGFQKRIPIHLEVHDYTLPKLDMSVGFFGITPYTFGYVKTPGVKEAQMKDRFKVLEILAEEGFTTFTGLPDMKFTLKNGVGVLESDEVDQVMKKAKELGFNREVFTYGSGQFLSLLALDQHSGQIQGHDAVVYHKELSKALERKFKSKSWLPIVCNYSDEASGYSQKVERDMKRYQILKTHYPFLLRGGFSHGIKKGEYGYELNNTFTDGSFSHFSREDVNHMQERGLRWGKYNLSLNLFHNNRRPYGEGLYRLKSEGAQHAIGWAMTLNCNYPYFDLDGREHDAMMVFRSKGGDFHRALKFEWTAMGLEDYRLLSLLSQKIKDNPGKSQKAKQWLEKRMSKIDVLKKDYNKELTTNHSDQKLDDMRRKIRHFLQLLR